MMKGVESVGETVRSPEERPAAVPLVGYPKCE